jgi:hypothetical protein
VPDITDLHPTFEQSIACGLEVRDYKIHVPERSDGRVGESGTDLNRAARARRSELDDSENVVRLVVNAEGKANLIGIESLGSANIAYRQSDHFD